MTPNVASLQEARLRQGINACHMSLYPTKDSLIEAIEYIEAQAPYQPQDLFPLIMIYHNTLIQELTKDSAHGHRHPGNRSR